MFFDEEACSRDTSFEQRHVIWTETVIQMCCYNSWHTGTADTQMMESCQKLTRFVSKEEICCVCVCVCGGGRQLQWGTCHSVGWKEIWSHTLRSVPNLTNEFPVTQKVNKNIYHSLCCSTPLSSPPSPNTGSVVDIVVPNLTKSSAHVAMLLPWTVNRMYRIHLQFLVR